jgi:hypothetical protein
MIFPPIPQDGPPPPLGDQPYAPVPEEFPECYSEMRFYGEFTCPGEGAAGTRSDASPKRGQMVFKGTLICQCYCSWWKPDAMVREKLNINECNEKGRHVHFTQIKHRGKCLKKKDCSKYKKKEVEFKIPLYRKGDIISTEVPGVGSDLAAALNDCKITYNRQSGGTPGMISTSLDTFISGRDGGVEAGHTRFNTGSLTEEEADCLNAKICSCDENFSHALAQATINRAGKLERELREKCFQMGAVISMCGSPPSTQGAN